MISKIELLKKLYGYTAKAKIVNFLLEKGSIDCNVAEIHNEILTSRITIKKMLYELIAEDMVDMTRKIGTSRLYRIKPIVLKELGLS